MDKGLLRINCVPIDPLTAGRIRVRMKDTIGRVLHWHEPPVQVPVVISVQTVRVPDSVIREFGLDPTTAELLVCDKPATVPVHPAGPYLANTLTLMVEAQEQLHPLSLIPVHRTDRVTSGLTLCARDPAVSRAFHKSLTTPGAVRKLYLALVAGRFYGGNERQEGACQLVLPVLPIGSCGWQGGLVKVDAPVETIDAANGLRAVTAKGKPSTSLFQHLAYSEGDNTSLIACFPVTGRNHQLRVHLQLLGFPIVGDAQYAGRSTMDEESNRVSRAALDLMNLSLQLEGADGRVRLPSLLEEDVRAARSACPACSDGDATSSFTPAQLLREGHAIRLHALRYQVSFLGKKASNQQAGSSDATLPPLAICDFRVDPPAWAKALLGNGDGDMLRDLPFLETS
jgi:23S rRNA-/tRNA-specific pseudouridylate synthase